MISQVECCDCMDFMAKFPDKFFDLAIVDPPYGIGGDKEIEVKKGQKQSKWQFKDWDKNIPAKAYFDELFRVSQSQIIWGGNYFPLPPTRCFLVWDKVQRIDMADCEFAWTSFSTSARIYTYARSNIQGFRNPYRFHPTEKPIDLYKWILTNYAKPGDKILDTHLGSQSSRIPAYQMGFDFWGCEIDPEYFADGCKRFEKEASQQALFVPSDPGQPEQIKIF